MDIKFTVGELAKLHNLSKQTLIFYDKIGLFKPKIIDSNNNYRYYTSEQLEVLDSILILKEIGIPLKEIKTFLEDRNIDSTLELMKKQKKELKKQELQLKLIIKRLTNKIETLENIKSYKNSVYFKETKEEYLAAEKVEKPYDLLATNISIKKLLKNVMDKNHSYNYQVGVMIAKKDLKNKNYTKASYTFLPLNNKVDDKCVIVKHKGLYAVTYHKGKYEEIGKTYEKLLSEIYKRGYDIGEYSYEYCVLDSLTSLTPDDYVTEIGIMVK